jgi:sulfur carrier protein ThiS
MSNDSENKPTTTTTDATRLTISATPTPPPAPPSISVNIGVPGKIRKLLLEGNQSWTVKDVLRAAELNGSGYDVRMGGKVVSESAPVTDGQTILLLRPVRGN